VRLWLMAQRLDVCKDLCRAAASQWIGGRPSSASGRRATATMRPAIGSTGGNEDVGRAAAGEALAGGAVGVGLALTLTQ
jgi:hypothetical protein